MSDSILAWHFIGSDRKLKHGDNRIVQVGETLSVEGELELCAYGLHASRRVIDALSYASNNALVVCRVECWGDVVEGSDKLVARYRKTLWMLDVERILHQFSVDVAREALDLFSPSSTNPKVQTANRLHYELLDLKQQWINGELTDEDWATAWDAAWAAAWATAWATARAAAWAAAQDAELDEFNTRLENMILAEFEKQA